MVGINGFWDLIEKNSTLRLKPTKAGFILLGPNSVKMSLKAGPCRYKQSSASILKLSPKLGFKELRPEPKLLNRRQGFC